MKFQTRLAEIGLEFIVGVQPRAKIWSDGLAPLPPKSWSGPNPRRGRPPSNLRRDADHQPIEAKSRATRLSADAWQEIIWRDGTKGELVSRFAHARIRPAHLVGCGVPTAPHRDYWRNEPWPELTILA